MKMDVSIVRMVLINRKEEESRISEVKEIRKKLEIRHLMENRKKHNYKNLKIWQIANDVFEILSQFHSEKKYDLSSQMKRCAISIPNNLVEVTSKTNKSFSHFIDISLGSSCELVTQLIIANNRNYLSNEKLEKNENKLDEFQRMTTGFQKNALISKNLSSNISNMNSNNLTYQIAISKIDFRCNSRYP